jgi:hypothetical protein
MAQEPPDLPAKPLEEAVVDDGPEVAGWPCVTNSTSPSRARCRHAEPSEGRKRGFAVEWRGADGRLLWVTGATVPVDEPPTPAAFKVAVLRLSAEEAAPAAQPAR